MRAPLLLEDLREPSREERAEAVRSYVLRRFRERFAARADVSVEARVIVWGDGYEVNVFVAPAEVLPDAEAFAFDLEQELSRQHKIDALLYLYEAGAPANGTTKRAA